MLEPGPREVFAARLSELLDLADLPLERVADQATGRRPPGERWQVTAQRLSDWRRGGHLPQSDQAFDAVIRILIAGCRGKVDPGSVSPGLLSEADWRRRLRSARKKGPQRPRPKTTYSSGRRAEVPGRQGESRPRLPGMPRVWNIPARNPGFTGREKLLEAVREQLVASDHAVVQALHGLGGVGKTQAAIEYAHRFARTYDLAWWIAAEQAGLIGEQFSALAAELGCAEPGAGLEAVRSAVLGQLREEGRWLLVFDNAEAPADISRWLPGGNGHVLITSREQGWTEIAVPVEIDVLARAESVAILHDRVPGLAGQDASKLAEHLGDLPLAVAQAAGFMAQTGMPAAEYMSELETRAAQILSQATPASYPLSLAAATQLIADQLASTDRSASQLADLCAFLAPEPVPLTLIAGAADKLPSPLRTCAVDPAAWYKTLSHVTKQSLARVGGSGLQMHRLTQAILRDRLSPRRAATIRSVAESVLGANRPGNPQDPATWPEWGRLMPHLLASDISDTADTGLRARACDIIWYLYARGEHARGFELASEWHRRWSETLGGDNPDTLSMAIALGIELLEQGDMQAAWELHEDTLARCRRVLGEDHPDTFRAANSLACVLRRLGEVQAARELDEDTLARRRRVLGEDHKDTLGSAHNLAIGLRQLGEVQTARELDEDTLARRRRVLGDDHPETLSSAQSLAHALRALGELQPTRELDEDILARRRRVQGQDHPDFLGSARILAAGLREAGGVRAARELGEDTLARRRRLQGDDHPETLHSANLADALREMGEVQAARELDEDTQARRRRKSDR
jgi:hypothetical protein